MEGQAGLVAHVAVNSRCGGLFSGVLWERWVSESNNLAHLARDQPQNQASGGAWRATFDDVVRPLPPGGPVAASQKASLRAQVIMYGMTGIAITGGSLVSLFLPMGYEGATRGSLVPAPR